MQPETVKLLDQFEFEFKNFIEDAKTKLGGDGEDMIKFLEEPPMKKVMQLFFVSGATYSLSETTKNLRVSFKDFLDLK